MVVVSIHYGSGMDATTVATAALFAPPGVWYRVVSNRVSLYY